MKPTISLVMIVKDEERTLKRCLESVAAYVDEIVIVDTGSQDNTKQIAEQYHAKIIDYVWIQDFAAARNFAVSQSTSDWNLVLDADEYISNDCEEAMRTFIAQPVKHIGRIKRIDAFKGTDGVNYEQSYISRLLPADCRYEGRIHEQVQSHYPRAIVDIEIQHDGYYEQSRSQRNIPILQAVLAEQPNDPYYLYQLAKEYRGLDEHELAFQHVKEAYLHMQGNENYAAGIVINLMYAIIASGHLEVGLSVIENEQQHFGHYPDFYFVSALYLLELILSDTEQYGDMLPLIEQFYQRALEIGESDLEGSVRGTGSFAAHHNLGVFYEVTGQLEKAKEQYLLAATYDYSPSLQRLEGIQLPE